MITQRSWVVVSGCGVAGRVVARCTLDMLITMSLRMAGVVVGVMVVVRGWIGVVVCTVVAVAIMVEFRLLAVRPVVVRVAPAVAAAGREGPP